MATTTTNYGFDIPQSTDLVKDGATAIATLGQDIDTAMNTALGTKKAGMVLLNTTSFSGVASQSVNNVFSATYDTYKMILFFTTASTLDNNIYIKFRVGGVDASGANYFWGYPQITLGGSISSLNASAQTTGAFLTRMDSGNSGYVHSCDITIQNPFVVAITTGQNVFLDRSTAGAAGFGAGGFFHESATSYDGFSIIPSAGNISGEVRVYGYNK
jgi:hypothetical protein